MLWFFGREACGILAPRAGIEPAPPPLEGEVLTTGPPGKVPLPRPVMWGPPPLTGRHPVLALLLQFTVKSVRCQVLLLDTGTPKDSFPGCFWLRDNLFLFWKLKGGIKKPERFHCFFKKKASTDRGGNFSLWTAEPHSPLRPSLLRAAQLPPRLPFGPEHD